MPNILLLILKDFRLFLRDRPAVLLTFAVPAVLMAIFGMIYAGGGSGSSSDAGLPLLVVDEARTTASARIIEALEATKSFRVATTTASAEGERPLTRDDARELLRNQAAQWRHALILPADFLGSGGEVGFNLILLQNPQSPIEVQMAEGMIQKTLWEQGVPLMLDDLTARADAQFGAGTVDRFQDLLAQAFANQFQLPYDEVRASIERNGSTGTASDSGASGDSLLGQMMRIEREQIAGEGKNPAVQSVAGWAVIFLLFTLSSSAASLLEEKQAGMFLRLLSGPVSRLELLWSKFFWTALLGVGQLVGLFAFGHALFGIFTRVDQILPLLIVVSAGALACSGFGMILASFCKTEAQSRGVATLLILSMSALGGAMIPSFLMPAFVQDYLSPLTIVYWTMDGVFAVLWRDAGFTGILRPVAVLLAITAVTLPISIWRFRTGNLFR